MEAEDGDNAIDVNIIEAGSEHTEEFYYNQLDGKLAAFADKLPSNLLEEVSTPRN